MRKLIIISSSSLTLLFLVVLAWGVWTVVRAPLVMQTAALPWAHEQQQDRMRLAANAEAEARKVEEQQESAPPAASPPSQGSPIGARGRNTDVPTSLAGAPLPPFLVFTPGPIPPSLVTPDPLPPSLVFTPGPLPPPSSLSM